MTNFPLLWSARELHEQLSSPDLLIVQVVSQPQYQDTFIPGAIGLVPQMLVHGLPPAPGNLPSVERLNQLVSHIGLTKDTLVVVADDEGGAWAGRLAWTLDMVGHSRWCYLDGGIHAWLATGKPIVDTPTQPRSRAQTIELDNAYQVDLTTLMGELQDPDLLIWDCRTPAEYTGQRHTAQRNGHIPGAVNLDWTNLIDPANHLQVVADLEEQLTQKGIEPTKSLVVHCQTHHRSGFAYMMARLLGFPKVRAYAGSWSEWGNHPHTPIATGDQ